MKPLLICLFLLFAGHFATGQSALLNAINDFEADPDLKHASFGICVVDVEANKVIVERNADLSLIPASSLKVLTTGTALSILGNDYQYKTELLYDGTITDEGVLQGNLILRGTGDPTLGSPEMDGITPYEALINEFAEQVRQKGIVRIEV